MLAGLICGFLAGDLTSPLSAAPRGWQGVALDAVLAAVAVTGAVVLADGLLALPALVRFLRAGGWPKIRCRAGRVAAATVAAGGGLAGLVLVSGSHPPAQLNASWAYWAGVLVTGLAMAAAIGLWAAAATATSRHITLTPRVRAAQLVLGAVIRPRSRPCSSPSPCGGRRLRTRSRCSPRQAAAVRRQRTIGHACRCEGPG